MMVILNKVNLNKDKEKVIIINLIILWIYLFYKDKVRIKSQLIAQIYFKVNSTKNKNQ